MAYRLTSACCLLLVVLAGCHRAPKKPPTLQWTGQWERTDLVGAYHSYIRMDDGRVAYIGNHGETALNVAFTREPGDLLRWTPRKEVMAFEVITDLPDPADTKKPAADRFLFLTGPRVAMLASGDFLGLGMICRGYPAVDGRNYIASFTGTAENVNLAKQAMLAGGDPPKEARWNYAGKVKGPVGEYLEEQTPFTVYPGGGGLIHLPDGPASPDHVRPTRNRFLAFTGYVGSPDPKKDAWLWLVLLYSADGREWFFAKDSTGAIRNLTPGYSTKEGYAFPFVLRRADDEWWMWRSGDFQGDDKALEKDKSLGVDGIFLYYSPDGLNWQFVRREAFQNAVMGKNGKPLGVKNMSIYYDPKEKRIHGFLSVVNEDGAGWWRKYHNIAKVTRE